MTIKRCSLVLLLISWTSALFSQGDDFGVWAGFSGDYQIIKKVTLELSGCVRTFNNVSQVEQYFFEGGAQYKINKYFSASASYRLVNGLENDSKYYFRHKLFFDLKGSLPVHNFDFSGRLRLQQTTKTYIKDDEDLDSKYYLRFKAKTAWNIASSPIHPYFYCEPFLPVFSSTGEEIGKYRLSAGSEVKLTHRSSIDIGYIFQRDYQSQISNIHIVSVTYNFKY
jgi:hypothetical protein